MASFVHVSLLLLLVAAPDLLCGIEVSEPGEIILFGTPSLSIAADAISEELGTMLTAIEDGCGLPSLTFKVNGQEGVLTSRFFLNRRIGFIELKVYGFDGRNAKLLFNVSNFYLLGFANQTSDYFSLKGCKHLMPGSTELPFGVEYRDLLPAGDRTFLEKMADVDLGKPPFLEGISTLSMATDPNQPNLPLTMATYSLMIPESLRIAPIRQKMIDLWATGEVGHLDERSDADYIHNWGRISRFLLCSSRGHPLGKKGAAAMRRIHITTETEALGAVAIIVWPQGFNMDNLDASCNDLPKA